MTEYADVNHHCLQAGRVDQITKKRELRAFRIQRADRTGKPRGGPVDMNVLCAIPNAIYMESGGKQEMVNGEVLAPAVPGMSSELKPDYIPGTKFPDSPDRLCPDVPLVNDLR